MLVVKDDAPIPDITELVELQRRHGGQLILYKRA